MKNITVSVSDEAYHQARIHAAECETSISAIVRDFLEGLTPMSCAIRAGDPDLLMGGDGTPLPPHTLFL